MTTSEPIFTGAALSERLGQLPAWRAEGGWLRREFRTSGWRVTMLLVNAIAFLAEAANHHPDLEVHWGNVTIRLQTHSAGGITEKDFELAGRIEALATWQPPGKFPGLEGQSSDWIAR
jgi:4a-hydroxytetrahydrobiopterin dehydratase